jgi:hypothetical protein
MDMPQRILSQILDLHVAPHFDIDHAAVADLAA